MHCQWRYSKEIKISVLEKDPILIEVHKNSSSISKILVLIKTHNYAVPPGRVWRSTWLDFSSQGPPFTSVVDTLSSGGKVPLKEGRDELDFWLVLATIGKKGKSSPPGLEALLEIYGSSVKRRPSWSLNSTTTSLPIL